MDNEEEIKPNYARYKLLNEKPHPPFMVQMFNFWQKAGVVPRSPRIEVITNNNQANNEIKGLKVLK